MTVDAPLLFIYQNGFRQISLPPKNENERNYEVIQLRSCDDGVLVTTDQMEKDVENLNQFIGRKIVEIWCDTNEIYESEHVFRGAEMAKRNYGEKVIYLKC